MGNKHSRLFDLLATHMLTMSTNRVENQYEEYAKLPHYFFAFPGSDLAELRNEYFEKTTKGIQWTMGA